jgi:type I restriction enzyme M protein
MNSYEFRDYILGFIFYKYLSKKMETFRQRNFKPGQNKISRYQCKNKRFKRIPGSHQRRIFAEA